MFKSENGCSFENEVAIINKIKEKQMQNVELETQHKFKCYVCDNDFTMKTYITKCTCNTIYAVTPCSASKIENIVYLRS